MWRSYFIDHKRGSKKVPWRFEFDSLYPPVVLQQSNPWHTFWLYIWHFYIIMSDNNINWLKIFVKYIKLHLKLSNVWSKMLLLKNNTKKQKNKNKKKKKKKTHQTKHTYPHAIDTQAPSHPTPIPKPTHIPHQKCLEVHFLFSNMVTWWQCEYIIYFLMFFLNQPYESFLIFFGPYILKIWYVISVNL